MIPFLEYMHSVSATLLASCAIVITVRLYILLLLVMYMLLLKSQWELPHHQQHNMSSLQATTTPYPISPNPQLYHLNFQYNYSASKSY